MTDDLFNELLTSVREGGAILQGDAAPSRAFIVDGPNIKQLRATYGLSQTAFAAVFGVSVATLRNWEQGRRTPEGPARTLLQVAARHPQAIWDVVHETSSPRRPTVKARRTTHRRRRNTKS